MKMSKYSTLFLEAFQDRKSHSGKKTAEFGREWDTRLYIVLCKARYFGREGVKTQRNPCRQKLLVPFDTGKYYNWESGYKVSFLFMAWFNNHLRSSEQLGWKSRAEV